MDKPTTDQLRMMNEQGFITKDSGKRSEYTSGMVRDTDEGKARFDLLFPEDVPYNKQMLTRFADLMARGAAKYAERNWEKGNSQAEIDRAKSSALRHLIQWMTGEDDEDHAAAVMFNILQAETTSKKIDTQSIILPRPGEFLVKDKKTTIRASFYDKCKCGRPLFSNAHDYECPIRDCVYHHNFEAV